jgi:ferredoxin
MAATLVNPGLITAVLPSDALAVRGAFHPDEGDNLPGLGAHEPIRTLVLLGWTGGVQWPVFAQSPEAADGKRHPLDRWSRRLIDAAAARLGATAFYPFGGPPHHDFQRWALRAEPVARSPIGLLIHPVFGLWHAYRGALGFRERLRLVQTHQDASPCDQCALRPCLSACPAGAFTAHGYDVDACTGHVRAPAGSDCLTGGCLARRACPVAPWEHYSAEESTFHMNAFLGRAV